MKIFVDGYGFLAASIIDKLIKKHEIKKHNIIINTYSLSENQFFLQYLRNEKMQFFSKKYNFKLIETLEKFSPDIVFSLYSRRIIPREVLNIASKININLHPSLLPDYKGCFSAPWAILNQEKETGITFHKMVEEVDCGDILFQKKIKISTDDTGFSLYHKLLSAFIQEFDNFFLNLDKYIGLSQKMPSGGSYYTRNVPFDGIINNSWSIDKIDAFIRAIFFPPFKGAMLVKNGVKFECSNIQDYFRFSKLKV